MSSEVASSIAILVALQIGLIVMLAVQSFLHLRARSEARRNYEEMTRVARLALASEITATVAHNVTQPLSSILSNIEAAELLLSQRDPDLTVVREILADIRKEDLRANRIVEGLRLPLRQRELHLERVDVNALTANVLSLVLPDAMRRKVRISSTFEPGLPSVLADRLHLQQVLLNLVSNALDAMSHTPEAARSLHICTERPDRDNVRIAVIDNGRGIDPAQTERLFDSYFTTKDQGLGLGLSLARAIVQMHGGSIWAENRTSGGAAFMFTVPVTHKSGHADKAPHATIH